MIIYNPVTGITCYQPRTFDTNIIIIFEIKESDLDRALGRPTVCPVILYVVLCIRIAFHVHNIRINEYPNIRILASLLECKYKRHISKSYSQVFSTRNSVFPLALFSSLLLAILSVNKTNKIENR